MSNPPFAESDVLYRFTPSERERIFYEEYAVVRSDPDDPIPVCVYHRIGSKWESQPGNRPLIARLLTDLAALRQFIGSPGGPSYEELVQENDRLAKERAEMQQVIDGFNQLSEKMILATQRDKAEMRTLKAERAELTKKLLYYEEALAAPTEAMEAAIESLSRVREHNSVPRSYVLNLHSILRHALAQGAKIREGE